MPAKFIHGALVEFMQTFLIPLPNVIVFQYNPETIRHNWTQAQAETGTVIEQNPLAVKGNPGETFSFTLAIDARDMIADGSPVAEGIARLSGIYSRLAALEMLLYPVPAASGGLLGSVSVRRARRQVPACRRCSCRRSSSSTGRAAFCRCA
jgi:hypothetical protein